MKKKQQLKTTDNLKQILMTYHYSIPPENGGNPDHLHLCLCSKSMTAPSVAWILGFLEKQ